MTGHKDYYEILGVPRTASQEEIRKAYLKLAHKYHPDKTGGDKEAEAKLKEINEAYDTLKNPNKRAQYDAMGSAFAGGFSGRDSGFEGFGGFSGFGGGSAGGFEAPFDDFFDILFGRTTGGRARRRSAQPGADLEYPIRITLREAAKGTKKRIRFARREICPECNGTGAARGSQPTTCPDCHGAGQVRRSQGFFTITQTCARCGGAGVVISSPCARCSGSGRVRVEREIEVRIPAGISSGQRVRLGGEGEPGEGGGPRGDLFILVEIEPDNIFSREGNDIICEVPISFPDAALGAEIQVPTLDGQERLRIPAGTQSGTEFRLRGKGMPDLQGYRQGDEIVRVIVETPTKLSKEQRELLERFRELSSAQSYPLYRRFLDKVKESFAR
ncbi:MAG TPA: molecular chaperone DnaJ [Candidatus Hydrogenedentes bacterium]|nr:molecular chaperone DnaJ [Candidatus Hydrogenedentota bacterium]HOL77159.1 molecular chaperone DnaJ [Candidatus Hydrogenedentota bacterium]HPO85902.1 molecular chaperone DnaJ [Candidatus Hydrogenedentota bacterium]